MFQRLPVLADAGISLPEENARAIGYISQEARMFWLMSLAYNRERDVGLLAGMMSRLKGIRDLELIQLNLLKSVISDLLSSSL
jgi:ABC-type molybdate transport system ATPase subunit